MTLFGPKINRINLNRIAMTFHVTRGVMNDLMRRLTTTFEEVTGETYHGADPAVSVEGLNGFERLKLIIKKKLDLTQKKICEKDDANIKNHPRPRTIRLNNEILIMIRSIKEDVENLEKLHVSNTKRRVTLFDLCIFNI
jgi:hypothetical protein